MDEQGIWGDPAGATGPVGPRRGLKSAGLVAAGLVAGLVLAGLGVASAQSGPSPAPSAKTRVEERKQRLTERLPFGKPGGRHGGPGPGMPGLGHGAVHGEFTVALPDGGYRTYATQRGKVTAVSASSVTVKSDDGFSRTYQVNDETLVNAGNDGIGDVKQDDEVHVLAVVDGSAARAVDLRDVTQVRSLRERWMPRPQPSSDA